MTLPTLIKTWQFSINQTVAAQGSASAQAGENIRIIKNLMKGFALHPWTCSGSSNAGGTTLVPTGAGALDGVDRWAASTDINTGGSNGRHAWIVLRQTGIATNYEICIDFNNTGSLNAAVWVVSPSAGFTGGTATARPTATDEIVVLNATAWFSGASAQHQVHAWGSNDGQCTRIIVWRAGTNLCTFLLFDKVSNPTSTWTNPSITSIYGVTSGIAITYANLGTSGVSIGRNSTASLTLQMTGEGNSSGGFLPSLTDVGTLVNDFDSSWPIFPIGLCTRTSSGRGRLGNIFDLWWRPTSVADADTFPNDSNNRQLVAMGPLILPWTGTSTTALLT